MSDFIEPANKEEALKNLKKMQRIRDDVDEYKVYLKNAIPDGTGIIHRKYGFGYSTDNDGVTLTVMFDGNEEVKIDMKEAIISREIDTSEPGIIEYTERYILAFKYEDQIDEMLKKAEEDYERLSGDLC